MQVTPVTSADRAYAASSDSDSSATTTKNKTTLGQEDFMKLLAVQFQQQDPMKPKEDTEFIAQMAQFTSLDQTKALVAQMTQLSASQQVTAANSYIGRQVTLDVGNDQVVTGVVSGVEVTDGTPRLIVGDLTFDLSSVRLVEPAPATPSSTDSDSTNS
jgi:flagellar basal-body rod modification protein FlgD